MNYKEELDRLQNEQVTIMTYKVVEEELSPPNEKTLELLPEKAIEKISNDGVIKVDEGVKYLIKDMVEGAIDNFGFELRNK